MTETEKSACQGWSDYEIDDPTTKGRLNHSMLLLARNLRRLSQRDLMKPLNLDYTEYCKLENGLVKNSSIKIHLLAKRMHLPTSFFFQEYTLTPPPSAIQIRGLGIGKVRQTLQNEVYLDANLRLFHFMRLVGARTAARKIDPDLDRYSSDPMKLAAFIRGKISSSGKPLIGLVDYIQTQGVFVLGCNFDGPIDGVTLYPRNAQVCIFLNQRSPVAALLFALAKEFYHLLSARNQAAISLERAYQFARQLVAPEALVIREMRMGSMNETQLRVLTKRWMAPAAIFIHYATKNGIISADQAKSFLRSEFYKQHDISNCRHKPTEFPYSMSNLIELSELNSGFDRVESLHCSRSDLEAIYDCTHETC